jgi:hypothetical protein
MIGNFEGALSSRRKRAAPIIEARGKKSRKKMKGARKKCRLFFLNSRKGGK